jgi:short-subunit dehydrogenase
MAQVALITGASTGIGRALANQFARHGYDLVLVARNGGALREVERALSGPSGEPGKARPTSVEVIPLDLAQPHAGSTLAGELTTRGIQIDVVVNNAGFGLQGEFVDLPLERQLEMIQLNVTTLTELTRLLLPGMLARRTGGVLNVASTAAFQPGPLMSAYYATKAYVLSLTEGIAEEVAGRGLKVSCLCPGPTETEFAARAAMTGTNLFKGSVMNVDEVARQGFDGWNAGRIVIVPGFSNRRGAMVVRLVPRSWVRRIVKRLNSVANQRSG